MRKVIKIWFGGTVLFIVLVIVSVFNGPNSSPNKFLPETQSTAQKANLNLVPTDETLSLPDKTTQLQEITPVSLPPPVLEQDPKFYLNSDGNKIQSPTRADFTPAGATARCRDDSYSYSQHRSGTCSHHGGVVEWY